MDENILLLIAGGVLAFSVVIAIMAHKVGLPSLVAFLVLGMVIGTETIGAIDSNEIHLARTVGIIALVLILFEGGLSTSWRRLRQVALPAALLSTIGVVLTATISAVFIKLLFDLSWLESLLFGAVISSTDAAAVFASLRFTNIRVKLARTLEAETGLNDPMAIALTIGLITWLENPGYQLSSFVWLISEQIAYGLIFGAGLGLLAIKIFGNLPKTVGSFAPVASLAACTLTFGITTSVGGSGFLAVYLVGLAIGSTPSRYRQQLVAFHEGLAFLSQVILFIVLGLLITPEQLKSVALPGLIIAILLILIIRPIATFTALAFTKYGLRERLFIGLSGLRGAVPIVLGTFVLSAHDLSSRFTIFNAVFFIVLVSAIMQGISVEKIAKILGLQDKDLDIEDRQKPKITKNRIYEFLVENNHSINGALVKNAALPKSAILASVRRNGKKLNAKPEMEIKKGDIIFVIASEDLAEEIYDVFARWRLRI